MLVKEFLFHSTCYERNGNLLKIRVSEIRVKRICVNQGVGILFKNFNDLSVQAVVLKNQAICDSNFVKVTSAKSASR